MTAGASQAMDCHGLRPRSDEGVRGVIAKAEGLWRSMHGLPRCARSDGRGIKSHGLPRCARSDGGGIAQTGGCAGVHNGLFPS